MLGGPSSLVHAAPSPGPALPGEHGLPQGPGLRKKRRASPLRGTEGTHTPWVVMIHEASLSPSSATLPTTARGTGHLGADCRPLRAPGGKASQSRTCCLTREQPPETSPCKLQTSDWETWLAAGVPPAHTAGLSQGATGRRVPRPTCRPGRKGAGRGQEAAV